MGGKRGCVVIHGGWIDDITRWRRRLNDASCALASTIVGAESVHVQHNRYDHLINTYILFYYHEGNANKKKTCPKNVMAYF
jgi:hypothetical protein